MKASALVALVLALGNAACGGQVDRGGASSNSNSTAAGAEAGSLLTVSCDDGSGATDCCPSNATAGIACDAPPGICWTRCGFGSTDGTQGYRSEMSCGGGTWSAGLGLFPCSRADAGSAGPTSPSTGPGAAGCDHYFMAQHARGCGGPSLPPGELARIRSRFEQVCQNQYALPGSGATPAALDACAWALDQSPCELPGGQPAACTFRGSLAGGAPCNEDFQCQSGLCRGTVFFSPEGQIGPTTCGTCTPAVDVGQVCAQGNFSTGCPANAVCMTKDTTASMPTYTCVATAFGDVGAACDDLTALCRVGLYCEAQTGTCQPLAGAGSACGEGDKPPGNPGGCAPPLSCVGSPGAATCSIGELGSFCLADTDCAPGLGCIPGPCAPPGGTARFGCSASGTCGAAAWGKPGQSPCGPNSLRCLVGSCSNEVGIPAISPDGGLFPGVCPQVIPDGHSTSAGNTYASCDTFAESFLADYHFMNGVPSPAGTCTLLDSVVCK